MLETIREFARERLRDSGDERLVLRRHAERMHEIALSAHLSEETTDAQVSASRGIIHAIGWSWLSGFVLLAGLTFAIQDYAGTVGTATGAPASTARGPASCAAGGAGGAGGHASDANASASTSGAVRARREVTC